jgi:DNA-binding IclR family transcriptional regulator
LSYDAEVTQVWQLVGDAEAVAMRENERAILEALSELGEAGIQDIAEYIGKDRTSVLRTLHTLRAAGHVVMKSEGSKHIYSIKAAEKQ